jgi:hypothetical protein
MALTGAIVFCHRRKNIKTGLPDFIGATYQNWEKIYQITLKYIKCPQNTPNRP